MTLTTISVFGKTIKTASGKSFTKYSYTKDGKKFFRIAFKKTAYGFPTSQTGYLKVTFDKELVGKAKEGETRYVGDKVYKDNDTIYLDGKIEFSVDEEKNQQSKEKATAAERDAVNAYFD